jgi:glutamine amidotransferase
MGCLCIIEYGVGNVGSVINACLRAGIEPTVARDADELEKQHPTHLLLPGVGAVGKSLSKFRERGFEKAVNDKIREERIPILSICVGMQMMAVTCEEFGTHNGLGWIPASNSARLPNTINSPPLPHVGWNTISSSERSPILDGLSDEHFYFLHSYAMKCPENFEIARCHYGIDFTCAVQHQNIYGVQFHPEKSSRSGITLLKNFLAC